VGVLIDNRVTLVVCVCDAGHMRHRVHATQTSSLQHVHVVMKLGLIREYIALVSINTGAQTNEMQFEFVGVRMSVFVTGKLYELSPTNTLN
jgi:hypothetical protein